MVTRLMLLCSTVMVLVCLPASAVAQWSENFDSYALGSGMHGQGGWEGWGGDPTWDAYVTDVQSLSAPHSVDIVGDADLVHTYEGYTSGQWTYTANIYTPSDLVAPNNTYFILLNTYGAVNNWSTQIAFDPATGSVTSEFDGGTLPIVYDTWMELRVEIDLDADWQDIYYGGNLLAGKSWTGGVSGGGALNIGAVDLFAYGATSVYYDDMSLVPEPGACVLLALGALFGLRRR